MRRAINPAHVWTGLALSLLLFVLALTGSALVYKEAYWRLVYPELRTERLGLDPSQHAAAVAAASAHFGDRLRSVKFPEPGVGGYHLYLDDGEAFLSATDHHVIDAWRPNERVMSLLFDAHAHLMAGENGERVGGVIALLGSLLCVTGLVLWWPSRRRFSVRHAWPRDLSRRALLLLHRDIGVITAPLLLLLLLTGAGLVFYTTAQRLLNGFFGDAVPGRIVASAPSAHVPTVADASMIARVARRFPDGRIVFYYPPEDNAGMHGFRIKQPCELHPNGRSFADFDADGTLLAAEDACAMPPGERAVHAFYPLHAGKTPSGIYKLLVFLGGLVLAVLSASGVVTYAQKLRGRAVRQRGEPLARSSVAQSARSRRAGSTRVA